MNDKHELFIGYRSTRSVQRGKQRDWRWNRGRASVQGSNITTARTHCKPEQAACNGQQGGAFDLVQFPVPQV